MAQAKRSTKTPSGMHKPWGYKHFTSNAKKISKGQAAVARRIVNDNEINLGLKAYYSQD